MFSLQFPVGQGEGHLKRRILRDIISGSISRVVFVFGRIHTGSHAFIGGIRGAMQGKRFYRQPQNSRFYPVFLFVNKDIHLLKYYVVKVHSVMQMKLVSPNSVSQVA